MSVTCCDLNQLPISPAHTQGRGHSLTGSQTTANILDCRKQLLSLMTQGTAGLWSCGRTQACPQREKTPKTSPEQPKVLVPTPNTRAALISAAYSRVWVHFAHTWCISFTITNLGLEKCDFPSQASCTQSPWIPSNSAVLAAAMGTIPWCRNQFLPTCLNLLGGRGRRQGDGGHGRVSGGSRHLVDPQAGSGAVGSPHGAGGRDVCLRDQHEARRVHHPHSSCKTGQGPPVTLTGTKSAFQSSPGAHRPSYPLKHLLGQKPAVGTSIITWFASFTQFFCVNSTGTDIHVLLPACVILFYKGCKNPF